MHFKYIYFAILKWKSLELKAREKTKGINKEIYELTPSCSFTKTQNDA